MKDYTDIIIAPVITEKSAAAAEKNVYTFKVAAEANKTEIKKAVLGNAASFTFYSYSCLQFFLCRFKSDFESLYEKSD